MFKTENNVCLYLKKKWVILELHKRIFKKQRNGGQCSKFG